MQNTHDVHDMNDSRLKRFGRFLWSNKLSILFVIIVLGLYARHSEQVNSFVAEMYEKWLGDDEAQPQLAVVGSTKTESDFDRGVRMALEAKKAIDDSTTLAHTRADAATDANWNAMTANDSALVIRLGTEVAMVYGDTVLEKGLAYKGKYLLVDQRKAKPGKIWIQDGGWKEVARKK